MKSVIVFLSGFAVALAGAFIRSCTDGIPAEFAQSWCGNAPPSHLFAAAHAHCAGCAMLVGGLAMIAFAPLFINFVGPRIRAGARQS